MKKIKKILAPTDLSKLSRAGVRYAMELADAEGAEVVLYYVLEVGDNALAHDPNLGTPATLFEKHERLLAEFVEKNFADLADKLKIRRTVEIGSAEKKIVEKAEQERSDLIVMSTHGRTGLDHVLVGSVTERVVGRAPCPVLSIRPPK